MTSPVSAAPFGSWKSPITADRVVAAGIRIATIRLAGDDTYWIEARPAEKGRAVIVRRQADGSTSDLLAAPWSARTRVHEYGGGAYVVAGGDVLFSHFDDQRLYRVTPGAPPRPVTPERAAFRYADAAVDARRQRLICVREDHSAREREPVNTLVAVGLDGPLEAGRVLVAGHDFYSSPAISPDGARVAWLAWNHPNMPWDGTELWAADIAADGSFSSPQKVAGGVEESIFQPGWSPDGVLHFVSDRTGFWNLFRLDSRGGAMEPLCPLDAEFGLPQWGFAMSTYGFTGDGRIAAAYTQGGVWRLLVLDPESRRADALDLPWTEISSYAGVRVAGHRVVCVAGSATEPESLVEVDIQSGATQVLRRPDGEAVDSDYCSVPEAIEFPTTGERKAYAFYYRPRNRDFTTPTGERPPLLVMSHGGPTGAAGSALELEIQYWTSRGIAVLNVNYGGSSGYGRAYRERLNGQWGVVDVDDCVNGALHLVARGEVDGGRLAITGGSAGGFTTLSALTFRDAFRTGASHYGVSDLEALARNTHKFESRYMDRLIGPYPERKDLYVARSPIHATDRLSCPVIFFQGLDDPVVPPNQAERMVEALREKGLPVAYVAFPGEQHGFRQSANMKRALEAELFFYSRVFGFELADPVEPVVIENLGVTR
jgi:dipeptidyl aminopeptidase/acylaminoacyl peptidase